MQKQQPDWDSLTGLFSIIFGMIYGLASWNIPRAAFGNPVEPLYFPLGIAAFAIIVGILIMLRSSFSASIAAVHELRNESTDNKKERFQILYTCISCIVYALIFERAGYILSTFAFIFAMLSITSGFKPWLRNLLIAAVFAGVIYYLFSSLLSISLPPLPFGDE